MRKTLAVLIFLSLATPALAGTMYARFSAPVRSGRGLSAGILGRLEQGDPVDVQAREGRYYRISYKGKAAYIYYNKLAKEKPEDISDLLGGAGSGGIELTEIKAGGAIRGLSPMAENYAQASDCLLYTSPSPRDLSTSRMPSSA